MCEPATELAVRPLQGTLRVDIEQTGDIDCNKEQIAYFVCYRLFVPFRRVDLCFELLDLFGELIKALLDIGPVKVDPCGARRYLKCFQDCGHCLRDAVEHRGLFLLLSSGLLLSSLYCLPVLQHLRRGVCLLIAEYMRMAANH